MFALHDTPSWQTKSAFDWSVFWNIYLEILRFFHLLLAFLMQAIPRHTSESPTIVYFWLLKGYHSHPNLICQTWLHLNKKPFKAPGRIPIVFRFHVFLVSPLWESLRHSLSFMTMMILKILVIFLLFFNMNFVNVSVTGDVYLDHLVKGDVCWVSPL